MLACLASPYHSIVLPPLVAVLHPPGSPAQFRVSQQGASQNLTNLIKKDMPVFQPHLLIHEGDLSYARGSTPEW